MSQIREYFGVIGFLLEAAGVVIIALGTLAASAWFLARLRHRPFESGYRAYRRALGHAIILGLEFLIAGDIIRTVTVSHSLESVGVLATIVLIRAFLSITLEYGTEGRWPWRRARATRR